MNNPPANTVDIQTGLFNAELESSLISLIRAEKQSDPFNPVVVLVGSRLLGDYLSDLLLAADGGQVNTRFITFSDLNNDLDNLRNYAENLRAIPVKGQDAAVIQAIESLPDNNYFQSVIETAGFRRALKRLFGNFDTADLDFDLLFKRIHPDPTGRWRALSALYAHYLNSLKYYQSSKLSTHQLSGFSEAFRTAYHCGRLIVYGFYDFNPAQLSLIKSVASTIKLHIFMPYWQPQDDQGSVFDYAQPVYDELTKLENNRISKIKQSNSEAFCRRLFRYPAEMDRPPHIKTVTLKPALQIVRASGITVEIADIVGRINALGLWKGIPFERIAVILWQPDAYLEPLRTALDDAEIPYCDMIGKNLSDSKVAAGLSRLLSLISALRINHSDLVGAFRDQTEEIAWLCICQDIGMVEGSAVSWLSAVERYGESFADNSESTVHRRSLRSNFIKLKQIESLKHFLQRLVNFNAQLAKRGNWSSHALSVLEILDSFFSHAVEAEAIGAILRKMVEGKLSEHKIEWNLFVELLSEAIAETPNKIGRLGEGVVLVDKMTCRGVSFNAVFLPGMTQGSIPVDPHENPVMNDLDRDTLLKGYAEESALYLPHKRRRRQEEKLLFALAVDSARHHLCLSYSNYDTSQSSTVLPSRFLIDLCRTAQGKILSSEDIQSLPFFNEAAADYQTSSLDYNEKKAISWERITSSDHFISDWIKRSVPNAKQHYAYRLIYSHNDSLFQQMYAAFSAKRNPSRLSPHDGVLDIEPFNQPDSGFHLPITGIEKYAECPFNFYIQSVLKAEPWEDLDIATEVPPALIGNVTHRTLKRLYDQISSGGSQLSASYDLQVITSTMLEILDEELRRACAQCAVPQAVWLLTVQALRSRLTAFLQDDIADMGEFNYLAGEADVSYPYRYTLPIKGEVTLSGRIDRIDRSDDGKAIRIIDYKTGGVVSKPEKLRGGVRLQLPLYLKAMLANQESAELTKSLAQYVQILRDGSVKRHVIDGDQVVSIQPDLDLIVGTITTLIHRGFFAPAHVNKACDNCPSAPACHVYSREKSALLTGDANLELIRSLRGES